MRTSEQILQALASGEMDAEEFRRETALLHAPSFWAIEDQARPGIYDVWVIRPGLPIETVEMALADVEALKCRSRGWSVIGGEGLEFIHDDNRAAYPFKP